MRLWNEVSGFRCQVSGEMLEVVAAGCSDPADSVDQHSVGSPCGAASQVTWREAELPGYAFPAGAWERVKGDLVKPSGPVRRPTHNQSPVGRSGDRPTTRERFFIRRSLCPSIASRSLFLQSTVQAVPTLIELMSSRRSVMTTFSTRIPSSSATGSHTAGWPMCGPSPGLIRPVLLRPIRGVP